MASSVRGHLQEYSYTAAKIEANLFKKIRTATVCA